MMFHCPVRKASFLSHSLFQQHWANLQNKPRADNVLRQFHRQPSLLLAAFQDLPRPFKISVAQDEVSMCGLLQASLEEPEGPPLR